MLAAALFYLAFYVWDVWTCGLCAAANFWLDVSGGLLALLVAVNLFLFVRFVSERRQAARAAAFRAGCLTQPGPLGPAPRVDSAIRHPWDRPARPRPDFTRLLWYAYVLLIVVFIADVGLGVLLTMGSRPVGFPVRLLRPGIEGARVPHLEPLVVRVACAGNGASPMPSTDPESPPPEEWQSYYARCAKPILYFNSQRISWDQLGPLLEKELMRRPPEWPVYVQGDAGLEVKSVLRAIDIIRGKRAQVALLTDWGQSK